MSRLAGFFVVLFDVGTTIASFFSSSGFLLLAATSLVMSLALTATSSAIRSVLWPRYFWD